MLALLLALLLTSPSLKVSPRFSPEPATLTYTVSDIAGPLVCVFLDGPNYYTNSCRETTKTREQFVLARVPADTYTAFAAVCNLTATNCKVSPSLEVTITGVGEH